MSGIISTAASDRRNRAEEVATAMYPSRATDEDVAYSFFVWRSRSLRRDRRPLTHQLLILYPVAQRFYHQFIQSISCFLVLDRAPAA